MRHVKRHYLFWLVALLLLWQQTALAAGLCYMPGRHVMAATATPAARSDCMQSMHGGHSHLRKAACAEHCLQSSLVQPNTRLPNVPGSLLPPLAPAMPTVAASPRVELSFASALQLQADHCPLRLLFCSLQL